MLASAAVASSSTQLSWEWESRHKGGTRLAAAAEAARGREESVRTTRRLSTLQRKLLATLERFLAGGLEPVHVIIADQNATVRANLVGFVRKAAESNMGFGLPPLNIIVHEESEPDGILAAFKSGAHLAFIAIELLDDYVQRLQQVEATVARDHEEVPSTVFIVHDHTTTTTFDAYQLYRRFGVQDQLLWPPSLSSMRSMLHKWMPRTGIWISNTPLLGKRSPSTSPLESLGSKDLPGVPDAAMSPFRQLSIEHSRSPALSVVPPTSPMLYSPASRGSASDDASSTLAPRLRHPPEGRGCAAALGCGLRILIVSASPVSAATLVHYCEVFALWADYAADAAEAMRLFNAKSQPYDLVVVEPDLPGATSGYALSSWWHQESDQAVKRQQQGAATSVERPPVPTEFVCLSEEPDVEACSTFHMKYCFAKPFSVHCFAALLSKWLERRGAQ